MAESRLDRMFDLAGALGELSGRMGLSGDAARRVADRAEQLKARLVMGDVDEGCAILLEVRPLLAAADNDLARGAVEEIDALTA